MVQDVSHGIRKTAPTVAGALAVLILAAAPVRAQSMFEQMPSAPGEALSVSPSASPAAVPPSMSVTAAAPLGVPPAQTVSPQAAAANCQGIQKTLMERKALVAKANAASNSKNKMTPAQACTLFGQIQANGAVGIKWITQNKEWCSIPDSFSEGFKADNARVATIRTKVCGVAAQVVKMEAQAREGGGNSGLLGGPGLTGSFKMPQGAL